MSGSAECLHLITISALGAVEVLKRLSASKARSVAEDAPTAELANSTAGTIRQRLLKIGRHGYGKHAQVYIRLASAFPLQNVFAHASMRVSKEKNGKPKMECSTYV
jgi:hypothetical protein